MKRRSLFGGLGAAFTSALAFSNFIVSKKAGAKTWASQPVLRDGTINPCDVKINLKPVMTHIIHTGKWEGPCRWDPVSVSEEKARAEESFIKWAKECKEGKINLDEKNVKILEPVHIKFAEDFILRQEEINKLKPDSREIDACFILAYGSSISAFEIGKLLDRPIMMVGLNCRNVDIAAYTRSMGYEAFVPADYAELNKLLSLLRARKVFNQTSILFPTDKGLPAVCSICAINDLPELEEKLGVAVKQIPYKELDQEMNEVMNSKTEREKAEQAADKLLRNAQKSFIDRKYVVRSIQFYQTVKSLMNRHGCNAFTIECFEFCSNRLPEKWTITPCLIHTLLRDQGYASSCEADLGSLLAMQLLMSVSNKSCHQGNADPVQGSEDTFKINHSAPSIKMNGLDQPCLPYQLGRFVASGWGTKAVINFTNNTEKTVTVARVDPTASKVLVLKGELVGSSGWDNDYLGCSVEAVIKPPDGRTGEFMKKRIDYGNHLPWVYGDYSEEIRQLGEMLKLEVDVIS
ncbi:MAG TPA: hypothetical protein VM123_20500 [archaeon]|nr:hypothetical protein [archaeon]